MSSPIERTSRADLNGAAPTVLLPGQRVSSGPAYPQVESPGRRGGAYTWAELAERVGVSIPTLRHWVLTGYFRPRAAAPAPAGGGARDSARDAVRGVARGPATGSLTGSASGAVSGSAAESFAAVDVVRLEVLARLVRSGVPLARAAESVRDPG